jgi:uncharacterized membrane protein
MALKYLLGIHLLATIIWVGGMFFAFQILHPSAAALDPEQRLKLWAGVFRRFFPWVWAAVLSLLVSGYWMVLVYFGGMKNIGMYIHLMMGIGTLMAFLFVWLWVSPYRLFKGAMASGDLQVADRQAGRIRHILAVNLVMGLIVALVASTGKYFLN